MAIRSTRTSEAAETESAAVDNEAKASDTAATPAQRCPCCGGRMIVVETFAAGITPRHRPPGVAIQIDTS